MTTTFERIEDLRERVARTESEIAELATKRRQLAADSDKEAQWKKANKDHDEKQALLTDLKALLYDAKQEANEALRAHQAAAKTAEPDRGYLAAVKETKEFKAKVDEVGLDAAEASIKPFAMVKPELLKLRNGTKAFNPPCLDEGFGPRTAKDRTHGEQELRNWIAANIKSLLSYSPMSEADLQILLAQSKADRISKAQGQANAFGRDKNLQRAQESRARGYYA